MKLYSDATATIIDPLRRTLQPFVVQMGLMEQWSMSRFTGPLPLGQSLNPLFQLRDELRSVILLFLRILGLAP
jgi:hypothetical protein